MDFAIAPASLTITIGDKVRWTNTGGAHTSTSGTGGGSYSKDGVWDSGFIADGSSFSVTFSEPGVFTYFCEIHPVQMQGTITVEP